MENSFQFSIEAARKYAHLTQQQIADKLGISRITYGNYESGKVPMRIDIALNFSKITKIPINNIIFLSKNYTSSVFKNRKEVKK